MNKVDLPLATVVQTLMREGKLRMMRLRLMKKEVNLSDLTLMKGDRGWSLCRPTCEMLTPLSL